MKWILQLKLINQLETNGSIKSEIRHQCEVINPIATILLQQESGIKGRGEISYSTDREQIMKWS